MNYIITISREFGCGAREIARKLASELGVSFYDKELVTLAAEKAQINKEIFKQADEVLVQKRMGALFKEFGFGSTTDFYSEKAIHAQAQVIREIADRKKSCILFGRCADYILREYTNTLHFFLYAPISYRVKHIAEGYGLEEGEARKLIKRVDKQRHNYYKYVTGQNRGDRTEKNMMLDVNRFGEEGVVNMMEDAVKLLFE